MFFKWFLSRITLALVCYASVLKARLSSPVWCLVRLSLSTVLLASSLFWAPRYENVCRAFVSGLIVSWFFARQWCAITCPLLCADPVDVLWLMHVSLLLFSTVVMIANGYQRSLTMSPQWRRTCFFTMIWYKFWLGIVLGTVCMLYRCNRARWVKVFLISLLKFL